MAEFTKGPLEQRVCPACGTSFSPPRTTSRFCSKPCARTINGGQNRKAETWWVNAKGYVEGRVWRDGKQRHVKKHRYVVELHLGRSLEPNEDVHHIDGDKQNNDLSNLQIIDHGKHSTLSNLSKTYRRGYKMNLSDEERAARSIRMKEIRREALSRATGA